MMKNENILDAIGMINETAVQDAKAYQKPRSRSWMKWGAMAACLCLIVMGGIFAALNGGLWRVACGHTSHSITLSDNSMYFSEAEKGAYLYDTVNSKTIKIADFGGVFYDTASGVHLLDHATGELYSVVGKEIKKIGSLEYSGPDYDAALHSLYLIDVLDGVAYWTSVYQDANSGSIYKNVFATDFATGEKRELLVLHDSGTFEGNVIGDTLYYFNNTDNGSIESLDLTTMEVVTLYTVSDDVTVNDVFFYENSIVFETNMGLYQLTYKDQTPEKLTDIVPTTHAFDRSADKLYYVAEVEADTEALISFDLVTGEVTEIVKMDDYTYTEIVICENGYFFTDPSDSEGGLFYYNFETDTVSKISN